VIDCDFTDTDGTYYQFLGEIDNARSFSVTFAKAAASRYHGQLIASNTFGDSLALVRKKIRTLPKTFPTWTFSQHDGEGAVLETDYAMPGAGHRPGDIAWNSICLTG